jgi:hypothetical protein
MPTATQTDTAIAAVMPLDRIDVSSTVATLHHSSSKVTGFWKNKTNMLALRTGGWHRWCPGSPGLSGQGSRRSHERVMKRTPPATSPRFIRVRIKAADHFTPVCRAAAGSSIGRGEAGARMG